MDGKDNLSIQSEGILLPEGGWDLAWIEYLHITQTVYENEFF